MIEDKHTRHIYMDSRTWNAVIAAKSLLAVAGELLDIGGHMEHISEHLDWLVCVAGVLFRALHAQDFRQYVYEPFVYPRPHFVRDRGAARRGGF